jgi:hypothetical protein
MCKTGIDRETRACAIQGARYSWLRRERVSKYPTEDQDQDSPRYRAADSELHPRRLGFWRGRAMHTNRAISISERPQGRSSTEEWRVDLGLVVGIGPAGGSAG